MWPESKPIIADLTKFKMVEVYEVCDPHFGNECFNTPRWNRFVNYLLEKPYRFVIWNGDLMENAVPGSKSDPLTQTMSPLEQREYVVEMFKLFKDRTLAIVDGNHEHNRSTRMAGLYPLYDAACIAGIEDTYRSAFAVVDIKVGNNAHRVAKNPHHFVGYVCHKGKKMKNFATPDMLEGFDFVVTAHDHEPEDHPREHLCYNVARKTISYKSIEMIDNGANLFFGGYNARAGGRPKSDKMYYLILNGDRCEKSIESHGFYV